MAYEIYNSANDYTNRTLETVTEAVKNYANDVRLVFPVEKAIFFGSWVKGTATVHSDVDVCFFIKNCGTKSEKDARFEIHMMALKYYGMFIEPHVFTSEGLKSDHPFITEILETGLEI